LGGAGGGGVWGLFAGDRLAVWGAGGGVAELARAGVSKSLGPGSASARRHLGFPPLRALREVALRSHVVASEDRARAPAAELHHHLLGDAGADRVACGGAAEVMEEETREAGGLRGAAPRLPEAAGRPAPGTREHERAGQVAARGPALGRRDDRRRSRRA